MFHLFACTSPYRLEQQGEPTITWEYMLPSIVASFMRIGDMEGGVSGNVMVTRPRVLDPDIDFWAFGVMISEH